MALRLLVSRFLVPGHLLTGDRIYSQRCVPLPSGDVCDWFLIVESEAIFHSPVAHSTVSAGPYTSGMPEGASVQTTTALLQV